MATSFEILKSELTSDPLSRGYAGMDDRQAADSLNTVNRPTSRNTVSVSDFAGAIVHTEYADVAVTAAMRQYLQLLASVGTIKLTTATRNALGAIFGAATTTRANLLALTADQNISRAQELGATRLVEAADVAKARAI